MAENAPDLNANDYLFKTKKSVIFNINIFLPFLFCLENKAVWGYQMVSEPEMIGSWLVSIAGDFE